MINQALLSEAVLTLPQDLITGDYIKWVWRGPRRKKRCCTTGWMHELVVAKGLCIKGSGVDCEDIMTCVAFNYGLERGTVKGIIECNDNAPRSRRHAMVTAKLNRLLRLSQKQQEEQSQVLEFDVIGAASDIVAQTEEALVPA